MGSPRGAVGIALALVVLALTGCAAGSLPSSGPLAVYPRPDAGMDALLEGELAIVDDCLVIRQGEGALAVPVFPAGDASWAEGVLQWRDGEYREGDTIAVGGGFSGGAMTSAYIPQGCEGIELFAVSPF
jgi:hypothetical protein